MIQTDFNWRPITTEDAPQLLEMMQAVAVADGTEPYTLDGTHQLLARFGDQLATHSRLASTPTGQVVAATLVFVPPLPDQPLAMTILAIHPHYRQYGLGDELVGWQETAVSCLTPITLRTSCADHLHDKITLLKQHGFQAARYQFQMARDLGEQLAERPLPPHLTLYPWHEQHEPALMDAFNEAFAEHWGVPTMTMPLWKDGFTTDVPQFRGDLSFLIMHDSQIVGFSVNWVQQDKTGWIEAIGVRPNWRGQGIAAVLMERSLNAFVNEGLSQAMLDVDTQNPSGALRLYEKMGFVAVKRTAVFTKDLT
ncbi:MAG: GNAT family N-acetyltransferase [Chloroflexota bacterium]